MFRAWGGGGIQVVRVWGLGFKVWGLGFNRTCVCQSRSAGLCKRGSETGFLVFLGIPSPSG